MDVIHFTEGATDLLAIFDATGARIVPLAAGHGVSHVSCLHLAPGGAILIIIESEQLIVNRRGISTAERIAGQRWPSDISAST
jgi:hypothetical protein